MYEQLCLFDVLDCKSDVDGWTFNDLTSWARCFGLDWERTEYAGASAITCKKNKCEITLCMGRLRKMDDSYVSAIHFDALDRRNGGYSGFGCAYDSLDKCAEQIKRTAKQFGWERN